MSELKVKIRGIYTTALTKLLLDAGFLIVQPSAAICQRFHLQPDSELEQVSIYDGDDLHSIIIEGDKKVVAEVIALLKQKLPDVIIRPTSFSLPLGEKWQGTKLSWQEFVAIFGTRTIFSAEFPYTAKATLDALRAEVAPTLPQHHFLKLINAQKVDEEEISPAFSQEATKRLKQELIYTHYRLGRTIVIEHVLPEGRIIIMKGKLVEFDSERGLAIIKRNFSGTGKYDGLNVPQQEGDWGIIKAEEGSWICQRSYYHQDGSLIGELYNINTGIELYPEKIRYIDLKIDVVRGADGKIKVIDKAELNQIVKDGIITEQLASKAIKIAEELRQSLEKKS